jgi:hypothetical protein
MIEGSTAFVLIVFGYLFYRSADQEAKFSHIHWVVLGIRSRRDLLEGVGKHEEAKGLGLLANELSSAAGRLSLKVASSPDASLRASKAIMLVNGDDFLSKLGLLPGSAAFLPTKNALRWLASKVS